MSAPTRTPPEGVSPVIAACCRAMNDALDDGARNRLLKPYMTRITGTATSPADENTRAWMVMDWYCRVNAPAWLRAAGLTSEADAVEATAPIVDTAAAQAAMTALRVARDSALAAGVAAGVAAAGTAAGTTALDALEPTLTRLQVSALNLLDRLIAVGRQP